MVLEALKRRIKMKRINVGKIYVDLGCIKTNLGFNERTSVTNSGKPKDIQAKSSKKNQSHLKIKSLIGDFKRIDDEIDETMRDGK